MPRRKVNLPLLEVIGISLLLHVVGLFVLGGLTIWQMVKAPEPEFEAPPPPQEAVQPQELKVKLQKTQKQSRQPTKVIQATPINNLNLPKLDISMPNVDTRVAVGRAGAGNGTGRGFGGGGLDMSKSVVDFFGIESSGENIVFVVDVTRSMLEPERGDVWGFTRVKAEINRMIDGLSPGTLFNIYAYERGLDVYSSKPKPATTENKEAAKQWINQYWTYSGTSLGGRRGANSNNYRPTYTPEMPVRRTDVIINGKGSNFSAERKALPESQFGMGSNSDSRMELAILAALENYADTIFVVTDGTPEVAREVEENEYQRWYSDRARWERERERIEKSSEWKDYLEKKAQWEKKVNEYKAERKRKGLPPEVREGGHIGGIRPPDPPGGHSPKINNRNLSFKDLNEMLRNRAKQLYEERNRDLPSLNIVGYSVRERDEDDLKDMQRGFPNSRFRMLDKDDLERMEKKANKEESNSLL